MYQKMDWKNGFKINISKECDYRMNLKVFMKYIDLCKELNSKPSFMGLNYFKKAFRG